MVKYYQVDQLNGYYRISSPENVQFEEVRYLHEKDIFHPEFVSAIIGKGKKERKEI